MGLQALQLGGMGLRTKVGCAGVCQKLPYLGGFRITESLNDNQGTALVDAAGVIAGFFSI